MTEDIASILARYIASEILKQPNRKLGYDDPLLSSGLIDSFHLIDLALFIEDTFGVPIDDSELNASTFDTLYQLVDLIGSRK